ncbi:MAG TPA: ABC transporter ATP-binding protein [Gemmatimonadales bacterium]|nr:ABC transporter ATP-binding protein [Gemmatimonadales bacterium]
MRELRTLLPYLRRYQGTYLLGLVLVLVSNAFTTAGPRFLERGIDEIGRGAPVTAVVLSAALLVAVAIVGGAARFGMRQTLNSGSRRIETEMRDDLFAHLLSQSAGFFDRHPTGDVMARATNDLTAVRMVAGPALMYLVDTAVRAALIVPQMAQISLPLALLALLPLLGLTAVMVVLGGVVHERSRAIQEQFGTMSTYVQEHLSGVRVVRAYRQERAEERHFGELNDEYLKRNLAMAKVQGAFHALMPLLGGLGGVIVLFTGGRLVIAGTITAGAFVAFSVYLAMLVWPMIALGWAINLLQRGAAAIQRINELLHQAPAITSPPSPAALPAASGARSVTFEDVWFRYPAVRDRGWALQGVAFHVPAGRSLAIVGATGAGKSTVAELLGRAFDPDQGRILIDGVDIRTLELGTLRRAVGMVPQETFLFSDTLRHNVLLGAPDDGRLERVAAVSQLDAALADLPSGYDTMLGERGVNLSGGQKQRAAIARALAQEPPVFVLDDALSAVDAQTEAKILTALRSALAGRTTIVISHRLAAVRDADEIVVLDEGKVVERGTHAQLLAHDGRYAELVRRQRLEAELETV